MCKSSFPFSSSFDDKVRPINDLFQPHDYIRLAVPPASFRSSSDRSTVKELSGGVGSDVFHPPDMITYESL
jgi:hypothetical protein